VVINDQVAIRPMMYLALSYDHRLIDGEQAVTFLVRVKERIEDPTRMLLNI
jgi:2-oxoglutarate dehydrogenase E2 component (dihydrolipoamide succinyltransferase)